MNTTWSDFIQTTESLYVSRSLRFRFDNKDVWLPLMKISENMNVLEIGCAGGLLLHQLKQLLPGIHTTGIDRDDNHINYARRKTSELGLDCKFAVCDAVSLPFDDNTFDLTFSHTVIEHVPPQLFLREQYRVLKPGGIITVMSTRHKLSLLPKNWHRTTQFDEASKKLRTKINEFGQWIKENRNKPLAEIWETINQKLRGHYNYYGVNDNWDSLTGYKHQVIKLLFYWLQRRSQRSALDWNKLNKLLKIYPLVNPKPNSLVDLNPRIA